MFLWLKMTRPTPTFSCEALVESPEPSWSGSGPAMPSAQLQSAEACSAMASLPCPAPSVRQSQARGVWQPFRACACLHA